MKKGQKRIKNDDFEQMEECYSCHNLFWAKSKWELGNWERHCNKCQKKNDEEEKAKEDNIKKNGRKIVSSGGQIKGWILGDEKLFNIEYKPETEKEEEVIANGFFDLEKL